MANKNHKISALIESTAVNLDGLRVRLRLRQQMEGDCDSNRGKYILFGKARVFGRIDSELTSRRTVLQATYESMSRVYWHRRGQTIVYDGTLLPFENLVVSAASRETVIGTLLCTCRYNSWRLCSTL